MFAMVGSSSTLLRFGVSIRGAASTADRTATIHMAVTSRTCLAEGLVMFTFRLLFFFSLSPCNTMLFKSGDSDGQNPP